MIDPLLVIRQVTTCRKKLAFACCAIVPLVMVAGCTKPRALEEIEAEQRALPVLYLTEKSMAEVHAPADAGLFVDKATGELCYRAYECRNPDCPGKGSGDKPHLFIHRDVLVSVDASGEISWSQIPAGQNPQDYIRAQGGYMAPTCPKCAELRDLDNESDADRQKYQQFIELHEIPETAARREELEAEYQEAFEARERLREGG